MMEKIIYSKSSFDKYFINIISRLCNYNKCINDIWSRKLFN